VHADLRLGQDIRVGRKRVERLMRQAGLQGVTRRRRKGLHPSGRPGGAQRSNATVEQALAARAATDTLAA
jgi:transposase InsO family protein